LIIEQQQPTLPALWANNMSIEGMWAAYFGDVDSRNPSANSGILVLESGRIFGGDSLMAYRGRYELDGAHVTAVAETWAYNASHGLVTTAFGSIGNQRIDIELDGAYFADDGVLGSIKGTVWQKAAPERKLPIHLMKLDELP
jgi:hypothetical protein